MVFHEERRCRWVATVRAWKHSGLTQRAFAEREGVALDVLRRSCVRARFALLKNLPENLPENLLRLLFATKGEEGVTLLRLRQPRGPHSMSSRGHREGIEASLVRRVSDGRVEATNNQIRLLTRLAHGSHSAAALIALVFLKLGGLAIDLGRRPGLG